ncbi:unnamed protein product [Brassica oleracea]
MSNLKDAFAEEAAGDSSAVIMRTSVEEAPHPVDAEEAVAVVMAPNRVEAEEAVAGLRALLTPPIPVEAEEDVAVAPVAVPPVAVAPVAVAPVAALEVVDPLQPLILAFGEIDPALLALFAPPNPVEAEEAAVAGLRALRALLTPPIPVEAEEDVAVAPVAVAPVAVAPVAVAPVAVAPVAVAPVAALEVVAQPWILALGEVDPALLARALGVKVPHRRQSQRLQNRSAHERAKSRRARMSLEKYYLEVIEAAAEMGKQGGDGGGGDGGDGSGDDGGDGSGDDGGDGGGDDGVLG